MKILVLLLVLLILSCSMFKKTLKTSDENRFSSNHEIQMLADVEVQKSKALTQSTFHHDSIRSDYTVRLWPSGVVSYSETNGFNGQFDSIVLTGNRQRSIKALDNRVFNEKDDVRNKVLLKEEEDAKTMNKNSNIQSSPDVKTIFTIAIIVIIVIILIIKWYFL